MKSMVKLGAFCCLGVLASSVYAADQCSFNENQVPSGYIGLRCPPPTMLPQNSGSCVGLYFGVDEVYTPTAQNFIYKGKRYSIRPSSFYTTYRPSNLKSNESFLSVYNNNRINSSCQSNMSVVRDVVSGIPTCYYKGGYEGIYNRTTSLTKYEAINKDTQTGKIIFHPSTLNTPGKTLSECCIGKDDLGIYCKVL